jgi:hypothetical protein
MMDNLNVKFKNSKNQDNLTPKENKGRLQIKKNIFNKAIKSYIQDNYDSDVHFGSMSNNLEEIIKDLSIDTVIESSLRLPIIDINKLSIVNEDQNEFSNFDLYENFTCTFIAKEGIDSATFMKGIRKLETSFLDVYNEQANKEVIELDHQNRLEIRKREGREIIFFVIIAVVALALIYLFTSNLI